MARQQDSTQVLVAIPTRVAQASAAELAEIVKEESPDARKRRTGDATTEGQRQKLYEQKRKLGLQEGMTDYRLHSVMNYFSIKLTERDKQRYDALWSDLCRLQNAQTEAVKAWLAEEDPTKGARLWWERDDITARHRGPGIIAVSLCTQVIPRVVHWNHRANGECYKHMPVRVEGGNNTEQLMFVIPGSRDLHTKGPKVSCDQVAQFAAIYMSNGTWFGVDGQLQFLTKTSKLRYSNQQNPLIFNGPSIYGSEVAGVEAEVNLFASSVHRIGRRHAEQISEAGPKVRSTSDAVDAAFEVVEETGQVIVNATRTVGTWLGDAWTTVWNFVGEWKWWIIGGIVVVGVIALVVALCVVGLPALLPVLPFLPAVLSSTQAVRINAVQQPTAPMLEEEIPVRRLNYLPAIYHVHSKVGGKLKVGKQVQIEIEVNGVKILALYDPGANRSYFKQSVVKQLGLRTTPLKEAAGAANDTPIQFVAETEPVRIRAGTAEVEFTPWVSPDAHCPRAMLMGTDLIERIEPSGEVAMNLKQDYIRFGSGPNIPFIAYIECEEPPLPTAVRLDKTEILPPRSDNVVMARVEGEWLPGQVALESLIHTPMGRL